MIISDIQEKLSSTIIIQVKLKLPAYLVLEYYQNIM